MATSTARRPVRADVTYLDLVRRFPLRPIRSERELDRAAAMIDALLDAGPLRSGARDYLEVLSGLVELFEEQRYPVKPVADAQMLAHLIEARGTTQAAVARDADIAESTISAVLRGSRRLTREHIVKLSKYFHVRPQAFDFESSLRD